MDQSLLVKNGQRLVEALDKEGMKPTVALWYHDTSIDAWKLWLVPEDARMDKREFYRRVGECLRQNSEISLEISDVQHMTSDHRGVKGLAGVFRVEGISSVHLSNNMLDGFFIPDGIILRMTIERRHEVA